jgi:outer membrane protein, heavy metal efflux system
MPINTFSSRRLLTLLLALALLASPVVAGADDSAESSTHVDVSIPAEKAQAEASVTVAQSEGDQLRTQYDVPLPSAIDAEQLSQTPSGPCIALDECLRLALEANPGLAALQKEIWAADARNWQGSLKPNPEISAEISDFLGTAETRFFRGAVTGLGVSQLIERGRKRCARMQVAFEEGEVARAEIERLRLDIMLNVSRAYFAALAAQERLRVALELEQLDQQVHDVVALKVEAGKAARLELSRVDIDLAAARLAREQVERELATACKALALLWGETDPQFVSVVGELLLPVESPDQARLREKLLSNPDIALWDKELELRVAERDLAHAEGVPDLTVNGGLERFEGTDSFGFKIGVSMPLPLRNRNEGRIAETERYIEQVEDLRAAAALEAQQQLGEVCETMANALTRARALQDELLPAAQEVYELTSYGYRYGKFGMLEVLDSKRTLIEARSQFAEALAEYYLAGTLLERLIAQPQQDVADSTPTLDEAAPPTDSNTTTIDELAGDGQKGER